jgi:hypothetical protein
MIAACRASEIAKALIAALLSKAAQMAITIEKSMK